MDQLLIATLKVDVALKKQERRIVENMYADDDYEFQLGVRRGIQDVYELLVEQLREKQPEIVSQLNQIRRIINKM